jgi:hypothetical protein
MEPKRGAARRRLLAAERSRGGSVSVEKQRRRRRKWATTYKAKEKVGIDAGRDGAGGGCGDRRRHGRDLRKSLKGGPHQLFYSSNISGDRIQNSKRCSSRARKFMKISVAEVIKRNNFHLDQTSKSKQILNYKFKKI